MKDFLRLLSDILSFCFLIRFCSEHTIRIENSDPEFLISRKYGKQHENNFEIRSRNGNEGGNNDGYYLDDDCHQDKKYDSNFKISDANEMKRFKDDEEEEEDLYENSDFYFHEECSSAEVTSSCSFRFLPYKINYDCTSTQLKPPERKLNNEENVNDRKDIKNDDDASDKM